MTRNEILKKRYHFYRSEGYSAKEANRLKHRSLDVTDLKLSTRKTTNKTYLVNNEAYRNLSLDSFIVRKKRVKNNSVYSSWGNLTQNDPHKDDMMKHAYNIAKRDNKTLDYGYYYLYLMFTKNLTNEQVKEIAKTDKSFEMYVKGMKPKGTSKIKKKKRKETSFNYIFLDLKNNKNFSILGFSLKETSTYYNVDGRILDKDKYKLVDWSIV